MSYYLICPNAHSFQIARLSNPLGITLASILVFGNQLLALSEDGAKLFTWKTEDGSLQSTIQFEPGFTATTMLHPATYLNKILVGSSQGTMQLWNIRTQYVHTSPVNLASHLRHATGHVSTHSPPLRYSRLLLRRKMALPPLHRSLNHPRLTLSALALRLEKSPSMTSAWTRDCYG